MIYGATVFEIKLVNMAVKYSMLTSVLAAEEVALVTVAYVMCASN